ncbi:thiamine pyrophosphate-dependent enzyme [Neobacillus sp. Marseille-QA0830]
MARRYQTPFLTVIFNNQGWNATKKNTLMLYPDGYAKQNDEFWVNFDQPADLAKIAEAAGGALALTVSNPKKLEDVLRQGMEAVKAGRSAVIDVKTATI